MVKFQLSVFLAHFLRLQNTAAFTKELLQKSLIGGFTMKPSIVRLIVLNFACALVITVALFARTLHLFLNGFRRTI